MIRPILHLSIALLVLGSGCEGPPRAIPCELPADPTQFGVCARGSGVYGTWVVDEHGLPAYDYDFDDERDPRGIWVLSDASERRDHLFQLGNDRVIGVASSQGFVQLFYRDRGPVFVNRVDLAQGRSGGGYSYVAEDGGGWATASHLAPYGAFVRRRFGLGYAETETVHDGLIVRHHIGAPAGDAPFLVDTVTVTNASDRRRRVRHFEFWDVFRHPLILQLTRSGELTTDTPRNGDALRDAESRLYDLEARLAPGGHAVRIDYDYTGPGTTPADAPANRDDYPYDVFLARLAPAPTDDAPLVMHTDRAEFFGAGELAAPQAVTDATGAPPLISRRSAEDGPAVLVDEVSLELAAGESRQLRYAYGTLPSEQGLGLLEPWRGDAVDADAALAESWRSRLPYVHAPAAPFLHREMAWHAAQLQAAAVWDDYLEAHTVVQGSVYMYGHGLDGATRDFALFAVPLVYHRPELARELLRTIMRLTYRDTKQISYAVQGFGQPETAGIHRAPSDLDLFFLWALAEYVAATGDRGFLDERSPYWPKGEVVPATTLEHARAAAEHLMYTVGLGAHGLIRVRTGDWSDGILFEAADRALAEEVGESVPNTQMAAWVLPRVAPLFDAPDASFAQELRDWAADRRAAAQDEWVERWYRRAWFGPDDPYGEGHLNLESQIWALIGELPDAAEADVLLEEIRTQLDTPSPVGARRVPGGMLWHAITGLLTWGYTRYDAEYAWESLERHTMTAYAEHNPTQWYGIWSGPDALGVNGGTWGSMVTPMMDWPVMNANQHALPLLAMIRVAGIEPAPQGDGLRIDPAISATPVTVDLPLLRLTFDAQSLRGVYRAVVTGSTVLHLRVPEGADRAEVDGNEVPLLPGEPYLRVRLDFQAGDEIPFAIATSP